MGTVFRGGECQDRLDIETVQKEKNTKESQPALPSVPRSRPWRTEHKRGDRNHTHLRHTTFTPLSSAREITSPALSTAFSPLANRTQKRRQEPPCHNTRLKRPWNHTKLEVHSKLSCPTRTNQEESTPALHLSDTFTPHTCSEWNAIEEKRAATLHTTQTSLYPDQTGKCPRRTPLLP
jgi:hypothetical protein